ncbi:NAD(P)H-hydrate dehydratase [Halosimplex amylolyticum]|uniref:NAD(P)H-hydrate dehydratase n=1 Tax=Halosimplex amylolyticum TaxID=3396616 RepID=UPI003F55287B
MLTADRMRAVEANAVALGVSPTKQAEAGGSAVAREVRERAAADATVAVVAGRGANGGVALAAARHVDEFAPSVSLLGRPESIATATARDDWATVVASELDARSVPCPGTLDLGSADVVVDGILGPDRAAAPGEPERTAIESVDDCDATVVAVDVPSGLDGNTGEAPGAVVDADRVVALHATKPGLDARSGVTVADVGIPSAAERFAGPGDLRPIRGHVRADRDHGDSGRVFVIGGGPYTGAPALSAQAALRGGADLTFLAVPEAVTDPVSGYAEDLIVQPYLGEYLTPGEVGDLVETATDYDDVVVLGPGLGDADETLAAVEEFLSAFDGRAVVDADAIPAVPAVETDATLVLTPNTHELEELGGPSVDDLRESTEEIESFAADLGHALAVKSAETVVTDGTETRICRAGTPGLTVGGTGDVFAGLTAAFLGVAPPLDAATAGAFVKGRAGERLADRVGETFVASELLDEISPTIWQAGTRDR